MICLGWAFVGMASSGTMKVGYEVDLSDGPGEGGLLGNWNDSSAWIDVGTIQWHFGGISWETDAVASLPWEDADVTDKEELVIPIKGIVEGGGTIGVEVYTWGEGIACLCEVEAASRLRIWAAGDARRATSNCWNALVWSNSAIPFIWFANQIFCKACRKMGQGIEPKSINN